VQELVSLTYTEMTSTLMESRLFKILKCKWCPHNRHNVQTQIHTYISACIYCQTQKLKYTTSNHCAVFLFYFGHERVLFVWQKNLDYILLSRCKGGLQKIEKKFKKSPGISSHHFQHTFVY
jgi:hypothetical protein